MKGLLLLLAVLLTLEFSACTPAVDNTAGSAESSAVSTATTATSPSDSPEQSTAQTNNDQFTARDREVGYDESLCTPIVLARNGITAGTGVTVTGNTATITQEGSYLVSGTLAEGQLVIDAAKTAKIQLILDGVEIHSASSAAIYVKQADKLFITLAAGTTNLLATENDYVQIDDNTIDAPVFSKEDLTLNGEGSLTITSPTGHGIVAKDDLVITSGTYNVTAASHGLNANDSVRIAGGSLTITSGKDGIHAENAEDASLGYIYIEGGTFQITAQTDGMDAGSTLEILEGSFKIKSGGGSENASTTATGETNPAWGDWEETTTEATTSSAKGLKAAKTITIATGRFTLDSSDDALHSNESLLLSGGSFEITSGDDGIHADERVTITAGEVTIAKSYEGIEGKEILIEGGEISLTASDDGINAGGGNDTSALGGRPGMGEFSTEGDTCIEISGGTVTVNASGDGLDSNGALRITGGTTYVWGPTNGGNGTLDYSGEATITSGTLLTAGSSEMAQNLGTTSTQGTMLITLGDTHSSGTQVQLCDAAGTVIVSYNPEKEFNSILLSHEKILEGASYTLTVGNETQTVEMTSLVFGSGGMGGGPGGMKGGGGTRGESPTMPGGGTQYLA